MSNMNFFKKYKKHWWKSNYKLPVSFILFFVLTFFLLGEQLVALPTYLIGPNLGGDGPDKVHILDLAPGDALHRPFAYVIIGVVIWVLFRIFFWSIAYLIGAALWILEQLTLTPLDQRPSILNVVVFTFTFWILLTLIPYFIYRWVDRKWGAKGRRNAILIVAVVNILLFGFFAYQIYGLDNSQRVYNFHESSTSDDQNLNQKPYQDLVMITPYADELEISRIGPYSGTANSTLGIKHVGIDFFPVSDMTQFRAVTDGEITNFNSEGGNTQFCIEHSQFLVCYSFETFSSDGAVSQRQRDNVLVKNGDEVKQGDLIGKLIYGGDGAHVDLGVLRLGENGERICPELFFTEEAKASIMKLIHKDHPDWSMCYEENQNRVQSQTKNKNQSQEQSQQVISDLPAQEQALPSFTCPDELLPRGGLQTLAITNGVSKPVGKDEQDWITQNCPNAVDLGWTKNTPVVSKLPSCIGNALLSVSPIDPSLVTRLIPLGHIGTPHHATPMDHMEYLLPPRDDGLSGDRMLTNIKAPGAVHIIGVRQTIKKLNGVIEDDKYYSIAFTPCKEILFYFEAMGSISDSLKWAVENAKNTERAESETIGSRETILKEYRIDYRASPGEIIGTAGGPEYPGATLDWGVYDFRIPKLGFLGEQPDPRIAYTTCPIDYFLSPLKEQLYEKFDRKSAPLCGEVMQDLAGTIQGNWIAQGKRNSASDDGLLGIVHDNIDPSIGVIGVAGTLTNHGSIDFTPEHSGFINREPSEVKADVNIYCYQSGSHKQVSSAIPISGRILIQLLNNRTLKIEYQEKSCDESFNFISPTLYER